MRKVNILWAEDRPGKFSINSDRLKSFLKAKGVLATVKRSKDGIAVHGHLVREIPDVLLVDIRMPDYDGLEAVRDLSKSHAGLPMIIVSDWINDHRYRAPLLELKREKIIRGYFSLDDDAWCEAVWQAINVKAPAILHLSDIHFGADHAFQGRLRIEDMMGRALKMIIKKGPIDLVVISGDLSSRGTEEEFRRAKAFLYSMAEELHLSLDRFFIVPGNHDIYRSDEQGHRFTRFVDFLDTFYAQLDDPGLALQRYPELYDSRRHLIRWDAQHNHEESLYSVAVYEDLRTVLIGLNSVISDEAQEWNLSRIEPLQLTRMANRLDELSATQSNYFRIAIFHHNPLPVPSFTDDGEPERIVRNPVFVLHELIQNRVKLVLHGHTHYSAGYKYQSYSLDRESKPSPPIHVLAAGTLSGKELPRAQSFFHLTTIRCDLNQRGQVASAIAQPYRLGDDSLTWEEGKQTELDFEA